ncbi:MAG: glycoside hydrolase family 92 protein [Bifidobacteriaceae bacterium]|jgi:putative alpha-1,2-mannosidase|nr:glycoside hydrolase family 92 protein [Bifidobacteriaceae bacterium]
MTTRPQGRLRKTVCAAVATTMAVAMGSWTALAPAQAAGPLVTDPLQYVHTLAGTQGSTNNFPGPTMPFGMVQFSPSSVSGNAKSTTQPGGSGYKYNHQQYFGIGMTFASQGCGMGGDFPIMPTTYDNLTASNNDTNALYRQKLTFDKNTEVGQAGYYKVEALDTSVMNGNMGGGARITTELTATTRGGIAKFTFPAGSTTPKVILRPNATAWSTSSFNSEVHVDPVTGLITARALVGNFCRKGEQHEMYYALRFDTPFAEFGTWQNNSAPRPGEPDAASASNVQTGAYLTWPDGTELITARAALSYTSIENAVLNLNAELPSNVSFDDVRAANEAAWRTALGKVKVSEPVAGQSDANLRTFYSALYHSATHPATFNDVNGEYIGFESTPQIHNVSEHPGANGRTRVQYSMISDWDTYRCLTPFQAALWPDVASDQAQSLVNAAEQMGSFPNWTVANTSTTQMNGDDVAPLLAFTHQFGARDWDMAKGLEIMLDNTIGEKAGKFTGGTNVGRGFPTTTGTNGGVTVPAPAPGYALNTQWHVAERPGGDYYNEYHYAPQLKPFQADHMVTGGSYTLEYAIDDFSIAEMAKALGQQDVADQFYERANWWQNLWNPSGNALMPRDVNGRYPETSPLLQYVESFGYRGNSFEPGVGQQGWEEGNGEQYMWMVPHNIAGLIDALGGEASALNRLETFFSRGMGNGASGNNPWMNLDNEPNFGVPWVFNYLGRPDRTSEAVDTSMLTQFGYAPAGAEPGNDDLGALANWFVWSALGMYPETSGGHMVTFNTPLFDKTEVTLGNGVKLTINAEGAQAGRSTTDHRYITGMQINGQSTTKSWLDWQTLTTDTTIDMTIDSTPGTWGTGIDDRPPSWRNGDRPASLNVNTTNETTFGAVTLRPGRSTQARVDVQRIGSPADTYEVTATSTTPGLSVSGVGERQFSATGRGSTVINLTADPDLLSGYYTIDVTVTTGGQSSTEQAIVRVVKPGSIEAMRTITGTSTADALKGSFDGGSGCTWQTGVCTGTTNQGTNMGPNFSTNTYDRAELAEVGLTPGKFNTVQAGGQELTFQWPTAPIGYAEAYQPTTLLDDITLDRPASVFSAIGASYALNGQTANATLVVSDGQTTKEIRNVPIGLSNWVTPSTNGDATDGTLAPTRGDSKVAWMPHRLAVEWAPTTITAGLPGAGAYLWASQPYVAEPGWKVVGVRFFAGTSATSTNWNNTRIFAFAGDKPEISLSSHLVDAGDDIAVTASGLAANEAVTITIDTVPPTTTVLHTDALGELFDTVRVSRATQVGGAVSVHFQALSAPGQLDDQTVVINSRHTYQPTATVQADAVAGQSVAFEAAGFEPGETVTATLDSASVSVQADSAGTASGQVPAPSDGGDYTLTISGVDSLATVSVAVTVANAPAPPVETVVVPGPTTTVAVPGPTTTVEVPGPTTTVAVPGPTVTEPGATVTAPGPQLTAQAEKTLPIISMSASKLQAVWGAPVTVTASVGKETGQAQFYDGTTVLGTANLVAGTASITLSKLSVGAHAITARFLGNSNAHAVNSSAKLINVFKAAPTKISVSGKAFTAGAKPKLTVKVGKLNNGQAAQGKVRIYVAGKAVKTVTAKSTISVKLPKAYSKTIKVKATFLPKDKTHVSSKTTKTVKVKAK